MGAISRPFPAPRRLRPARHAPAAFLARLMRSAGDGRARELRVRRQRRTCSRCTGRQPRRVGPDAAADSVSAGRRPHDYQTLGHGCRRRARPRPAPTPLMRSKELLPDVVSGNKRQRGDDGGKMEIVGLYSISSNGYFKQCGMHFFSGQICCQICCQIIAHS